MNKEGKRPYIPNISPLSLQSLDKGPTCIPCPIRGVSCATWIWWGKMESSAVLVRILYFLNCLQELTFEFGCVTPITFVNAFIYLVTSAATQLFRPSVRTFLAKLVGIIADRSFERAIIAVRWCLFARYVLVPKLVDFG